MPGSKAGLKARHVEARATASIASGGLGSHAKNPKACKAVSISIPRRPASSDMGICLKKDSPSAQHLGDRTCAGIHETIRTQGGVDSVKSQQFAMPPTLDNPAVVQDEDLIRVSHGR